MIKKDYIAIAKIIKGRYNHGLDISGDYIDAIEELVDELVVYMEIDNPRFNRDKFLKACGIK